MEERVSEREELRVLRHDLADLPDRQRAALVLRELNGLGHAEIGAVLEMSPAAVKQAIFEARTALFSCREGREMACHDVRRMLSDGDGRVLRGRGVRAHLRSCPDCRRFKSDLEHRPAALRMLAPPLPTAGAAALLSQLLGGPTAKLLACVAIAGGGTTVAAVEMHDAAESRNGPRRRRPRSHAPSRSRGRRVLPVTTSVPQQAAPVSRSAPAKQARRSRKRAGRRRPPAHARPAARRAAEADGRGGGAAGEADKPEKPAKPRRPKPAKPPKPAKARKRPSRRSRRSADEAEDGPAGPGQEAGPRTRRRPREAGAAGSSEEASG